MAGVLFQCTACRVLGVPRAAVVGDDGTSVGLVCADCARTSWVPVGDPRPGERARAAAPAVAEDADAPPMPLTAPVGGRASAGIALPDDVRGRVHERVATLPPPSPEQAPLAARFAALVDGAWGTEAQHKSLLQAAVVAGELAFVGSRYRAVLDVVRDEPRARAAQQELLTLAMATMKAPSSDGAATSAGGRGGKAAMLLVVLVVVLGAAGTMIRELMQSLQALGNSP